LLGVKAAANSPCNTSRRILEPSSSDRRFNRYNSTGGLRLERPTLNGEFCNQYANGRSSCGYTCRSPACMSRDHGDAHRQYAEARDLEPAFDVLEEEPTRQTGAKEANGKGQR
jgi:hypothetical protein